MIRSSIIAGISVLLLLPIVSSAQVAGSTLLGVAAAEMREVTYGWSAKRQVLGKSVYNDKNQRHRENRRHHHRARQGRLLRHHRGRRFLRG